MFLNNNHYPTITLYVEYNEKLIVEEKIHLPVPQVEIILEKPADLISIGLKSPGKIGESKGSLTIMLGEKKDIVEIRYELKDKTPLYSKWILAPQTCYTIDATIRTPLPLKSLVNAEEYGFHAWGKYGYSRWISRIPRREYILSIDNYLVMDEQTYIIASPNEKVLDELKTQVEHAYTKTKEIIPWKRPLIAHNADIGTLISPYAIFIDEFSWENIIESIVKSITTNTTNIPLEDKLVETIKIMMERNNSITVKDKNPYLGLTKLYGKDFLMKMLNEILYYCPSNLKLTLESIFGKNIDIIMSLLERHSAKIVVEDDNITCVKGPCVVVLEKESIEYLKAILEENTSLKISGDYLGKSIIHLF